MISRDIEALIANAIREDIGDGDHTSNACIPSDSKREAILLCKQEGILAGVELAKYIFKQFDPEIDIDVKLNDGTKVRYGDIAFSVKGKAREILKAERLVLNCMQRMSGIATKTNKLTTLIQPHAAKILDTRKTTPGFRAVEKWAVEIGGGVNHRFGLYDMVMIKDNHIDFAGGITKAVSEVKDYLVKNKKDIKVEVEARNLEEVQEILSCQGVHRILLDNFTPELMTEAVGLINGKCETEASGGIDETTIASYAATGVDYISVGALTHQIESLDLSLKATPTN